MAFLTSLEYRNELVAAADVEFLGRPADAAGQAAWAERLARLLPPAYADFSRQ